VWLEFEQFMAPPLHVWCQCFNFFLLRQCRGLGKNKPVCLSLIFFSVSVISASKPSAPGLNLAQRISSGTKNTAYLAEFTNDEWKKLYNIGARLIWSIGLPAVVALNEVIKRQEIKMEVRYQKRQRLEFQTKLGINSPFWNPAVLKLMMYLNLLCQTLKCCNFNLSGPT
jgi:hypothetical protein